MPAPAAGEAARAEAVPLGSYAAPNAMPEPGTIRSRVELGATGIPLAPNTYTLLRVTGTMKVMGNPYKPSSTPGQVLATYTPVQSGEGGGRGWTNVWLRQQETGTLERLSFYFRPDAARTDEILLVRTRDKTYDVWADREQMPGASLAFGYCMPGFPYCDSEHVVAPDSSVLKKYLWIEDFWIVQSHVVTATRIPEPLTVEGPAVVAPEGTASFSARPWGDLRLRDRNGLPSGVQWVWYPNDTTGTTPLNILPEIICSGQPLGACQFTPNESGRLHIVSSVEGAIVETDRIVQVADPEEQEEQQPTLTVVCTPAAISRGDPVGCTASVAPASEMIVTQRSARGPGFSFSEAQPDTVVAGDSAKWSGTAVASTQVRFTVRVQTAGQSKVLTGQASFSVTPRTWSPYQLTVTPMWTIGLRGPMTDYPTNGNMGNFGLNGLDAFSTPIDSVGAGPNAGLMYFKDRPPYIGVGASIVTHPGLYARGTGSAGYSGAQQWYTDQNGAPRGTCTQADVPLLRTEAERHEGLTQAPNSHFGVANQAFNTHRPDRAIEALYLYRVPQAQLQNRAFQLYTQFVVGPGHSPQAAFDASDYPTILAKFSCQFDFNKFNH